MDLGPHRIEEAFCMFHDGVIRELSVRDNEVNLRIQIRYLAEMVHPAYHDFYVTLQHCYKIWFRPWSKGLDPIKSTARLNAFEYEILEARTNHGRVEVSCTLAETDELYRGGELIIEAGTIQVYNEEFDRISVDDLKGFSKKYWKNIPVE